LPLDGNLAVGDPGADRVVIYDVATGAVVQTIPNPDGTPAGFGSALARLSDGPLADDLLIGAPGALGGGAVYRISRVTGEVRSRLPSPAPALAGAFGSAVSVLPGAVVVGDPGFSLLEDGIEDGAAFVFEAATGQLLAVLGRGNLDSSDGFGASLLTIGQRLFVGAPHEDVNTVTGFELDCGSAAPCVPADARIHHARARITETGVTLRARLGLRAGEMAALRQDGGAFCLYGDPSPDLRCTRFACVGDDDQLRCAFSTAETTGNVVISRRQNGRSRLAVKLVDPDQGWPAAGPLAFRLNTGPLTQQWDGATTRSGTMVSCKEGARRLRCR
jgi:hypothetical protein